MLNNNISDKIFKTIKITKIRLEATIEDIQTIPLEYFITLEIPKIHKALRRKTINKTRWGFSNRINNSNKSINNHCLNWCQETK